MNLEKLKNDPDYLRCKHGMIEPWCYYCLGGESTCGAEAILNGWKANEHGTVDEVLKNTARGKNMPKWDYNYDAD